MILAALAVLAAGCHAQPAAHPAAVATAAGAPPQRVVSLDYCADQFVIGLADRGQIAGVSPDAVRDFSYLRGEAAGLPVVRPTAEAILAARPDLVVRSYGGGAAITGQLERLGIPVHQIGWGDDFEAVRTHVREAASAIGQVGRGEGLVARLDRQLAAAAGAGAGRTLLYVSAAGVTTGPQTGVGRMITAAGFQPFETRPGWHPIDLERLADAAPDHAATAFFDTPTARQNSRSPSHHPVARRLLAAVPGARLDGATTVCAGWFVGDAVTALAEAAR